MFNSYATFYGVPYEDKFFVERVLEKSSSYFEIINDLLKRHNAASITQDSNIHVKTGKTSLAVQYARKYGAQKYNNIVFLDLTNDESYEKSVERIDPFDGKNQLQKLLSGPLCQDSCRLH